MVTQVLSAQTELLNPDDDVDDLFGSSEPVDESTPEESMEEDPVPGVIEEPVVQEETSLVDIVRGSSVTLSGDFTFNIGYTAGYVKVPWIPGSGASSGSGGNDGGSAFSGFSQGALTDTRSLLGLNFRIAPIFRVFISFRFDFPTFKSEIAEFF